jgi:hypothetical protein
VFGVARVYIELHKALLIHAELLGRYSGSYLVIAQDPGAIGRAVRLKQFFHVDYNVQRRLGDAMLS